MTDINDYDDLLGDFGLMQDSQKYPNVTIPKTITQLIVEHTLTFPFVIKKITSYHNTMSGLYMQTGTILTVHSKLQDLKWSNTLHEQKYLCYADKHPFEVTDTPEWMLVEKSDDNVLSLNAYRKLRESKKVRLR